MKKNYSSLFFAMLISVFANAQVVVDCGNGRYDHEVFSAVDVTSNIPYGSNVDYQSNTTQLTMDIYEPQGDTAAFRPLIVWAHGGSFVGGTKTDGDVVSLATHFAKRGYVCVSILYRLGVPIPPNQAKATQAVFRGVQDMKAAIRYMRQDADSANLYRIDPNMIFGGGSSAGAFMALHLAYLDQQSEIPSFLDTTAAGLAGGMEGNSGTPGYPSNINAVINLCGALGDKHWMTPGEEPLCSMHGTNDNTVPYNTQMLVMLGLFPIMIVDGSYSVNQWADSLAVPNVFYTWFGQDHVPYAGTSATQLAYMDTTVRFVSNFLYSYLGCTPSDPNPLPNTFNLNTGVSSVSNSTDEIILFPNPANNYFTVAVNNSSAIQKIELVDVTGRKLRSMENISSNKFNISRGNLSAGMYFVKMIVNGKTVTKKISFE